MNARSTVRMGRCAIGSSRAKNSSLAMRARCTSVTISWSILNAGSMPMLGARDRVMLRPSATPVSR